MKANKQKAWYLRIAILAAIIIGAAVVLTMCHHDENTDPVPTDDYDLIVDIMDATSVYGEPVVEDFDFSFDVLKSGITISKDELKEHITFEKEAGDNVGTYDITGTADQEIGLNVKFVPGEYTITKATYDMTTVHFEDQQVEYNGEIQNITITGKLPEGVKVSYNYSDTPMETGTYTVTAKFTGDEANYNPIPDMTAHLTIVPKDTTGNDDNKNDNPNPGTKKPGSNENGTNDPNNPNPVDPSDPGIEGGPVYIDVRIDIISRTSVYREPIQDLDFEFTVLNGESNLTKEELKQCIHLNKEDGTDVGEYRITGTCSREDIRAQFIEGTYTITKATYDMTGVRFNNNTVTYNGKSHSLFITGQLPKGVTVTYEGNGKTATGRHKVIAHFAGDAKNYEAIPDMIAYLTIKSDNGGSGDTDRPTPITRRYTITFVDYDGTVLKTERVREGNMPTPPANPTRPDANGKTYTFNGWSPKVVAATSNATYTATYTEKDIENPNPKQYTITFVNYDGTVLKTETVKEGKMPTPPANPTRPDANGKTYTFNGWSPKVAAATSNATYTATYTEKDIDDPNPPKPDTPTEYTVTFVDHDGTVLWTGKVEEGKTPTLPANPTRPDADGKTYTFTGWTPTVSAVTGEITYTATYKEEEIDPNPPTFDTPTEYTVTFVDHDGKVLWTGKVEEGKTPTLPADPTRPDADGKTYTFTGWTPTVSAVTGEITYTATYKEEEIDQNPPTIDTPIVTDKPEENEDQNPPTLDTPVITVDPETQDDPNSPDENTEVNVPAPVEVIPVETEIPVIPADTEVVEPTAIIEEVELQDTELTEKTKEDGEEESEGENDEDEADEQESGQEEAAQEGEQPEEMAA